MTLSSHNSAFSRVTALATLRPVHGAFAWLHGNPKTIMDWQTELVAIPGPPFGEEARSAWMAARFAEAGLSGTETAAIGNVSGWLRAARLPAESTGPVVGNLIESEGPFCSVGESCEITNASGKKYSGEVVGFRGSTLLSMAVENPQGIRFSDRIVAWGTRASIRVGEDLLGRVIDATGNPRSMTGAIAVIPFHRNSISVPQGNVRCATPMICRV